MPVPPSRRREIGTYIGRLRAGTIVDDILCWREQRSVSGQLVVNYNRMKFMLRPNKTSAALAGKAVDIYVCRGGRLMAGCSRAAGFALLQSNSNGVSALRYEGNWSAAIGGAVNIATSVVLFG